MKMDFLLLLFVIVVCSQPLLAISSHLHPRLNNATDQHALLQFKANDPYNSLHDWTPNISFCHWTGVSCSRRRQRAIALNLAGMALQGSIPPFIGNLSFLRSVDLSNNTFNGLIPPQLGRLSRLRELYLHTNKFQGRIPKALSDCYNLKILHLGANNLSGNVPSSLGNLSALTNLYLYRNGLEGIIPQELGMVPGLGLLDLSENQFTGRIPTSLSNCTSLIALNLSQNLLSGHIPEGFGSNLSRLQYLYFRFNQLSGNIPASLANCSKLTILYLDNNRLSGPLPIELGKLPLLEALDLHANRLISSYTLPFLTALTNCSVLQKIDLANNKLSGMLPFSIGLLSPKLYYLSLSNNHIEGYIHKQIGNLTNLGFLALDNNAFRGSIPGEFVRLRKMEQLYLGVNHLQGNIPNQIGMMENLGLLSVSHNMLSEEIPDSLGQLQLLRRLFLDHNQFSGNIPASLGKCRNLELLDLSHNNLSGIIPPEVASLSNLQFYMNLSCNSLHGSLPEEMGTSVMTQAIDISANHLSGRIPYGLGSCIGLEYINMSHNNFQGPLPDALGRLRNVEYMDISWNSLSGTIPASIRELQMLRYIDFTSNRFTGEIPEGLLGNHNVIVMFNRNPGLCGPKRYSLPACPKQRQFSLRPKQRDFSLHPKQRHFSLLRKARVTIVVISALILWCLLVAGFLWRWYLNKKSSAISEDTASDLGMFSYQDLVTASNGFDQANLLGAGSFGSVYKGVLMDGMVVAIKVLNLQHEEASKSFNTECEILCRIRHRNLVRIIASCSNLRFRGLVLQFVSNGSLEKHLYSHTDENDNQNGCQLKLSKRLDIAIDIAYGLAYLHHDCFVQVVHRDLKPSNVLLDDKMKALVADFGIAKLVNANGIQPLTSPPLIGSIGYIAPEYGLGGRVSKKGDVYSFGILLLEMMTRKRPTDNMFVDGLTLQEWVSRASPNGLIEVVDGSLLTYPNNDGLNQSHISDCLTQLIHVALLCTKESPRERPTIIDVVRKLEKIRDRYGAIIMESLPPLERLTLQLRPEVVSFELDSF